jgi:hypothetical protein
MNFATFAASPPALHSWDDGKTWNTGGFGSYHLQAIFDFSRKNLPPNASIIETGAGCSTICFLYLEPKRLVSIAPDEALFNRIKDYCLANNVSICPLQRYIEGSEWVLPELAKVARSALGNAPVQNGVAQPRENIVDRDFDLALIDGLHNWPTSMIVFFTSTSC